jgi:uncharacterized Zn-finger protein
MNYYCSLVDPQNIVPTLLDEEDAGFPRKTFEQTEINNIYISQNINSTALFASNPSEHLQKNTDINCHSSNLEYSTASNYPPSQRFHNKNEYFGEDRLNDSSLSNAKKNNKNPVICEFPGCGKQFTYLSDLKRHSTSHSKTNSFICDVCKKSFSRNDNLKAHERLHTNEKSFCCTFEGCDEKFKTAHSLKHHMLKHNNANDDFRCRFKNCLKKCNTQKDLDKHYMWSHQCDPQFIQILVGTNEDEIQKKMEQQEQKDKDKMLIRKKPKTEKSKEFVDQVIADPNLYTSASKSFDVFFDELQTKSTQKPET